MILITHNILWSKYKGGVFSALHQLALNKGIQLEFLQIAETENDRAGLSDVDLSYHQYPFKLLFKGSYSDIPKLLLIKTLFVEIWRSKADFVLLAGYHLPEYWAMLLAARLKGKLVGVFCDSTGYDKKSSIIKRLFKKFFFSQCDAFFGYGQRSRQYLLSHNVPNNKIYYRCQAAALPHDYDVQQILSLRLIMRSYGDIRFLYVGRLSPEKNVDDLLYAFKLVLEVFSSANLVIVGSGPVAQDLVELSEKLNISKSVKFVGSKNLDELKIEYLKASCLILPSSSEPWGLVVNEALSYGCPVVVSNHCGCVPELVIDGETGFVFDSGNVDEMAKKMLHAQQTFVDTEKTARTCINFISTYSPLAAGEQILSGCLATEIKFK